MLYKPTSPSPYNSVIDPSKGVSFKASCVNINEISNLRLMLDDKSYQYYFPLTKGKNGDYTFENGEIQINMSNEKVYNGYKISNSNYERSDIGELSLSSVLKSPKNYNWQVRLYQDSHSVNIAYGFIQEVFKNATLPSPLYNSGANCVLKVRPHTNMFFDTSVNETFNKSVALKNLLAYYDDKVQYTIEINGTSYPVLAYYYSYDDEKSSDKRALQKDNYDDPLFAYIEIHIDNDDINSNDEYSIYTNYIDSNEFHFRCRSSATLEFQDRFGKTINPKIFADGITPSEKDNKLEIKYSNFVLKGVYSQPNGASVNYYRVALYQIDDGIERLIDDTGEIYKSEVFYSYDEFLGGKLYKLVFQLTDTDRKSITKSAYICPTYHISTIPKQLNVQPYYEHNSIIINFDDLISISGNEEITGECEFDTINVAPDTKNNGKWIIGSDGETVSTCLVHPNNSITYDHIDGTNEPLKCEHPLLSLVFRCTEGDSQDIFEITDDDGKKHKMSWQGHHFVYTVTYSANYSARRSVYAPFINNGFEAWKVTEQQMEQCITKTVSELSKNTPSYNVPYYALDDIPIMLQGENGEYDGLYWHTESIARDFWWHIVFKPHYCYIKCLNSPQEYMCETEMG